MTENISINTHTVCLLISLIQFSDRRITLNTETMSHTWVFVIAVCTIMVVDNAAGQNAKGGNCCNGGKILDTIQKVLTHSGNRHSHHHAIESHFTAFSACMGSSFTARRSNERIVFDKVITNYGKAYKNGIFTCPTNGLYVFDWNILTSAGKKGGSNQVVNGGFVKNGGWAQGGSTYAAASTSAVLQLKKGDTVWLYTLKNYFIHTDHSSFQGWLLREI